VEESEEGLRRILMSLDFEELKHAQRWFGVSLEYRPVPPSSVRSLTRC
jgi:hypothetical protein